MSRAEMTALGWDQCDIILVTGDAYIDHPSFGMALVGTSAGSPGLSCRHHQPARLAFGGSLSRDSGEPALFFGITAGNMDSMVNRYTADRKLRSDDAYTPNAEPNRRPDRAVVVYTHSARAKPSLNGQHRDRQHRGLPAPHCPLRLLERQGTPLGPARQQGRPVDLRQCRTRAGRAFPSPGEGRKDRGHPRPARHRLHGAARLDASDRSGTKPTRPRSIRRARCMRIPIRMRWKSPTESYAPQVQLAGTAADALCAGCVHRFAGLQRRPSASSAKAERLAARKDARAHTVVRLPSYEAGTATTRCSTPMPHAVFPPRIQPRQRARAGARPRRLRDVWLNPPPIPLSTEEMDHVYGLPYARAPHPAYGNGQDSRLGDDPLLGEHHARLLRRLHLLLDHRA
jgi:hypothetical protein